MGRVIRSQRKGAGGIFKSRNKNRKGAPKLRNIDFAERNGFIKGIIKVSISWGTQLCLETASVVMTCLKTNR